MSGGQSVSTNTEGHSQDLASVSGLIEPIKNVKNDIGHDTGHMKVDKVPVMLNMYEDLVSLLNAYGDMVSHDLGEFNQLSVNMKELDEEAAK